MARRIDNSTLGFVIALALITAVGVIGYQDLATSHKASGRLNYSYRGIIQVQQTLLAVKRAETRYVDLIFSGDERYLQPYEDARDNALMQVAVLTSKPMDPAIGERVAILADLIRSTFERMAGELQTVRQNPRSVTSRAALIEEHQHVLSQIRQTADEIETAQEQLIARQTAEYLIAKRRSAMMVITGSLLALGLVAGALWHTSSSRIRRDRAEEKLRRTEERLRIALASAEVGTWRWDIASDTLWLDANLNRILGLDPVETEVPAEQARQILYHQDRQPTIDSAREAADMPADNDVIYERRMRIVKPDGSIRWCRNRGRVMRDGHGKAIYMTGALADITEQAQIEDALRISEERFEAFMENSPIAAWISDPDGTIVYVSKPYEKMFGVSRDAAVGKSVFEVYAADVARRFYQTTAIVADSSHPLEDIVSAPRPDGVLGHFLVHKFSMLDAAGRKLIGGTAVDVTERVRSEQQLKALNESLEQRVAERTATAERQSAQLRKLAVELTQAEQRERRRLAQTLHDNLQQLLVGSRLLLGSVTARAPQEMRSSLTKIDELLQQSIEASRSMTFELSPPVLYDGGLIAAIHWLARWEHEKHDLEVTVDADPRAEPASEEVRIFLFHALRELLFNVVKHAGVRRARVVAQPADGGMIRLIVEDEGRGFEPGKLDNGRGTAEGFGLFSVKQRLELLGGYMSVESHEQGTRVTLIAPAGKPAEETPTVVQPAPERHVVESLTPRGSKPMSTVPTIRVLVADDHRILRELLAAQLHDEEDIEVIGQAADGQEAVELAREYRPDIVVMDLSMPRLNGIEATRQITREMPQIKVIVLSMHEREDMAATLSEAGATRYLTKSGPAEDLISAIRACYNTPSDEQGNAGARHVSV